MEDGSEAPSKGTFPFSVISPLHVLMLGVSHPGLSLPSRRLSKLRHTWLSQASRRVTERESRFIATLCRADWSCAVVSAAWEGVQQDSKGTSEQRAGDQGRKFKGKSHDFGSLEHPVSPQQLREMI